MSSALTKVAADVGKDVGKSATRKLAPYCPPYMFVVVALPLADIVHHELGASPWTTVGMTALTGGLSLVTWHSASSRAPMTRLHATFSTAALLGWLTACGVTGLTSTELKSWGMGGFGLAMSWTIRRLTRNTGTGEGSGKDAWSAMFHKVKIPGVHSRSVELEPNKITAHLQLPGGEVLPAEVAAATPRIAGYLGLPPGAVRFNPDPDRADRGELILVPEDVLRDSPTWPGPSHFGGTMADPCRVGVYEDSSPLELFMAADPTGASHRQLPHWLLNGVTRSGKGVGARNLLAEIATRRESSVIMIDCAKAAQNLGAAEELYEWFIRDLAIARRFIQKVLMPLIRARSDYLGAKGLDNWRPGCGLNHLIIWIEEASALLRDFADAVDVANAAASVGIELIVSIQRPSHDNLPTSVRSAMTGTWTFGTHDLTDTQMVMDEDVILAGAHPEQWGNKKPGYNYAIASGIDDSRWPMPARTYGHPFGVHTPGADSPAAQLRNWVRRCIEAGVHDPLDELSVGVISRLMPKEWAERTRLDGSPVAQLLPAGPGAALPVAGAAAVAAAPVDRTPIAPAGPTGTVAAAAADAVAEAEQDDESGEDLPEQIRAFITEALTTSIEEEPVDDGGIGPLSTQEFSEAAAALAAVELPEDEDEDEDDENDGRAVDGWAALAGTQERMKPRQARAHLRGRLLALDAEQPGREIRAADIAGAITETGCGADWGRRMLREFLEAELLENPQRGVYKVLRQPAIAGS